MLEHIKLLLKMNIDDLTNDDLLTLLIEQCTNEALIYTHRDEITTKLTPIVEKMVVYNYNRLGNEGVSSQSYSGVSESYIDGYSVDILKQLNGCRKLRML